MGYKRLICADEIKEIDVMFFHYLKHGKLKWNAD